MVEALPIKRYSVPWLPGHLEYICTLDQGLEMIKKGRTFASL